MFNLHKTGSKIKLAFNFYGHNNNSHACIPVVLFAECALVVRIEKKKKRRRRTLQIQQKVLIHFKTHLDIRKAAIAGVDLGSYRFLNSSFQLVV